MEIVNEASDKFKDKQDEICNLLFELLRQINMLESEISRRGKGFDIDYDELFAEYGQRLGEIVKSHCTEKLLAKGLSDSYSTPVRYGYINGDCKVNFIMRSSKKASVKTHYRKTAVKAVTECQCKCGIDCMHKFVLKNIDGKWLVDEVYHGFESNPQKWYSDTIR